MNRTERVVKRIREAISARIKAGFTLAVVLDIADVEILLDALIDGDAKPVAWELRRTVDGEQKREVTTHYPGTARFLQGAGLVDPEVRPLTYKKADHE